MRAEIYLCAFLAALLAAGPGGGQMADINQSDSILDPAQRSHLEPQGLLPTAVPAQNRSEMGWTGWTVLEGIRVTTSPAAVSPERGVIDLFVGGNDSGLWHIHHQENWSAWKKIFGPPPYNKETVGVPFRKYDLSVVHTQGVYHLFTWGPTNHSLYKRCWASGKEVACNQSMDWTKIEGYISSRPAAVVCYDRIYLFALNDSGWIIWNRADPSSTDEDQIWKGWSPLGGPFGSPPAATSTGKTIHLFAPDKNGEIVHLTWLTDTGKVTADTLKYDMKWPAATTLGTDIELFGVKGDKIVHIWHNGTDWQNLENLGGEVRSRPAVASDGSHIRVFAQGEGERLWEIGYVAQANPPAKEEEEEG